MFIDLTLRITPRMIADAQGNERMALAGHLGTHFDVMDKEFPLDYLERRGVVFDVRSAVEREITCADADLAVLQAGDFVAFCSGFVTREGYGGKHYFTEHPTLSFALIDAMLEKSVSIIGVDFSGLRRGAEHTPTDQHCAERGVFVVENLCNLETLLAHAPGGLFTAHTYPLNYAGMTGLPCRVVAKVGEA